MYELGAKILLKLREGPRTSVRDVAASIGEKPTNTATTWRVLRRLRQDGLVVRVPGLGWVRRDDKALSVWRADLHRATLRWLQETGLRRNKDGSPWHPDLDEVRNEVWRVSRVFPQEKETPLAFAAMKGVADGRPLTEPATLPTYLDPRENALRFGDYGLRKELLLRHTNSFLKPRPGPSRWTVWVGPEGTAENAEIFVPHGPTFQRGVPVKLPELTAKELVERAEAKAEEVEDPLPPHFRYATATEVK